MKRLFSMFLFLFIVTVLFNPLACVDESPSHTVIDTVTVTDIATQLQEVLDISRSNNDIRGVSAAIIDRHGDLWEGVSNKKIEILEHELTYGNFGNLMVVGVAENTAGKELSYAQIDVKFYDGDGILIGNSLDNVNNLENGEKWRFEVMYLDIDSYEVDSYKISVGTVW